MLFLILSFAINTSYVYKYQNQVSTELSNHIAMIVNGKETVINIDNEVITIIDSYRFDKEERYEILSKVKKHLENQDAGLNRTINNLEAEWSLHNYLYKLGLYRNSTKDVDLEFTEDSRWYVKSATYWIQILGI